MGINKTLTVSDQKCDATSKPMAGRDMTVSRIVPVMALVALAAGCGSSGGQTRADGGIPRALASAWATRASAIATAAAAGENCRASELASSLRDEIISKESRIPARLQKPLVAGANALADRITCTVPPQTVTVAPAPKPKPPGHEKPKPPHDHHRKHGSDEGNQG
jgi:hypothetical protein